MTACAPVNKIIPFSTVDGPGARTSIFLQGCNIACIYCHNPETQQLCRHCGNCVAGCPASALSLRDGRVAWNPRICVECDACILACPHNASPKVVLMTAEEAMGEVGKNMPFIRGITVSGGECTLYPGFLTELFRLAKAQGLHCLLDSNGTVDLSEYPELMELCDGVMLDVKAWDREVCAALTGMDNDNVKRNLRWLAETGKLEELRVVCMEGHVDAPAVIEGTAEMLGEYLPHTRLKLITFRQGGVRGQAAGHPSPSPRYMEELRRQAEEAGYRNIQVV